MAREAIEGDGAAASRASNSRRSRRTIARAARRGSTVAKRRKRQVEFERARRRLRKGKIERPLLVEDFATV